MFQTTYWGFLLEIILSSCMSFESLWFALMASHTVHKIRLVTLSLIQSLTRSTVPCDCITGYLQSLCSFWAVKISVVLRCGMGTYLLYSATRGGATLSAGWGGRPSYWRAHPKTPTYFSSHPYPSPPSVRPPWLLVAVRWTWNEQEEGGVVAGSYLWLGACTAHHEIEDQRVNLPKGHRGSGVS